MLPVAETLVTGIAADLTGDTIERAVSGLQRMKRKYTSTHSDGGQTTNKRHAGAVEENRYSRAPPARLSAHQKAHAAYEMAKDFMPRVKNASFVIFDHITVGGTTAFQTLRIYSGKDSANTATALHDRSGIVAETAFFGQEDVIPSGHSMLIKNSTDNSVMLRAGIFPISDIGLIAKGDNHFQRLGDYVQFSGMHITGRIECSTFFPMIAATAVPYVLAQNMVTTQSRPRSGQLSSKRKVRLMLVEVLDNTQDVAAFNDNEVYGTSVWKNNAGTDTLNIIGAPRLEQLLEVSSFSTISGSVTNENVRNGRWQFIDRKYRSNHLNENRWLDPTEGRDIPFRIRKDISFTLRPRLIPKDNRHATAGNQPANSYESSPGSYVNVDFWVDLKADMSYPVHPANDSQSAYVAFQENGSRQFYWYIFDDHIDHLITGGVDDVAGQSGSAMVNSEIITSDGYAMCQARLKMDLFYNDDL